MESILLLGHSDESIKNTEHEFSLDAIREVVQERIKPEWDQGIPFHERIIDTPLEEAAVSVINHALENSGNAFGSTSSSLIETPLTVWQYQLHRLDGINGAAILAYPTVYFGVFRKEDVPLWGVTIESAEANTPKAEMVEKLSQGFKDAGFPLTPHRSQ